MTNSAIRLIFLGTGTSQGVPVITCDCEVCRSTDSRDKRTRSSVLVEAGGQSIVVDTGPDFRYQMLRENIRKVDAVLFTHEHKDHISGLDDVRPFNFKYHMDMPLYATPQVQTALKREYQYAFAEDRYPGAPQLVLHDLGDEPFDVNGVEVIPINVMHADLPVKGFRFGDLTYITDANFISPEEKEKIKGSKVLILNALRKEPHYSHFTLDEAIELIDELQPEQAYLTHISHLLGMHNNVSAQLPDNVKLAYDGLSVGV